VVHNASQEASDQPATVVAGPTSRVGGWVESSWRTAFTVGLVTLLIGVIIVAWPEATIGVFAVLFGVQLFLLGIFNLVRSIAAHDAGGGERVLYALSGILSIIVGVLAMRHLLQTAEVMAILFGLTWLVGGIIELVNALSGSERWRLGDHAEHPHQHRRPYRPRVSSAVPGDAHDTDGHLVHHLGRVHRGARVSREVRRCLIEP
jgi:hypothetical protein